MVDNNQSNDHSDATLDSGIVMVGGASYNLVDHNQIYNSDPGGSQRFGISVLAATEVGNSLQYNEAYNLAPGGQAIYDLGTGTIILVPEPGSLTLLAVAGLVGLLTYAWGKRRDELTGSGVFDLPRRT